MFVKRAQERIRLQEALRRFSFVHEVKESDANFFLVRVRCFARFDRTSVRNTLTPPVTHPTHNSSTFTVL